MSFAYNLKRPRTLKAVLGRDTARVAIGEAQRTRREAEQVLAKAEEEKNLIARYNQYEVRLKKFKEDR